MIELEAAFQPVFGTHQTTEVILWQRVVNTKAVMWMLGHDLPPEASAPGTWLHDALEVRDRWESRLLRSAAWSPALLRTWHPAKPSIWHAPSCTSVGAPP